MKAPEDARALLAAIPLGTSTGLAHGRPFVASRSLFNQGRSTKLVAEERGGTGYVSMNFYDLAAGPQLFPCEMSAATVIAFLRSYTPDCTS